MEKKILNEQWFRGIGNRIPVLDQASIALVRQRIKEVAKDAKLSGSVAGTAALIATELGQNQILHARFGEMVVRPIRIHGISGIEIIAADLGGGIEDPGAALKGDFSTSGTMGAGLSSVYRLSDELDFDIRLGEGTCIWARKYEKPPTALACELAIMGRAYPGEAVSGDNAIFIREDRGILACVADGLGHGIIAHEASLKTIGCVVAKHHQTLESIILGCNEELRETRGATVSLVRFSGERRKMDHLGVGDTSVHLYEATNSKSFVMNAHVLGQPFRTGLHPGESASINPGSVLVMHTDGLKAGTSLSGKLDTLRLPAAAIAQYLLETFGRQNDDAIVLVAKVKKH